MTREMKVMLQDESLTKEQRFDLLAAVMFDAPVKNSLLASFAKSRKAGFEQINASRYRAIEREREWRKNAEKRRRHAGYIDDNGSTSNSMSLHVTPCHSMSPHDGLKQNKTKQGISPYKPPKGGKKLPKVVRPEDLLEAGPKKGGGEMLEVLISVKAKEELEQLKQLDLFESSDQEQTEEAQAEAAAAKGP